MNGARLRGANRPSVHPPIEPSADALRNPAVRAAYQSSMKAAREAYLSGTDPTRGAIYLNMPVTPDRSNLKFPRGLPQGVPISTQSGPYNNSFPNVKVPSKGVGEHVCARMKFPERVPHRSISGMCYFNIRTMMFFADSMQASCIQPGRSLSRGQTSKSAKIRLLGGLNALLILRGNSGSSLSSLVRGGNLDGPL